MRGPLRGPGGAARESGAAGEEKGLATQVAAPFLSGQPFPATIPPTKSKEKRYKAKSACAVATLEPSGWNLGVTLGSSLVLRALV